MEKAWKTKIFHACMSITLCILIRPRRLESFKFVNNN